MNQNQEQCSSGSEDVRREEGISPLNPLNVNFVQRFAKQTRIAAADDSQEKRLHLPETIWQLGHKRSIVVKKPPVAFLPRLRSLAPQLFAVVLTNKGMGIQ